LLKERGLTVEAVVADFVFKNIQPLKDIAYPAYLYRGIANSTRVTNRRIPAVDLVSWLKMILRGKVSNVGAPIAYSAWNLPPSKTFISFVSNPPAEGTDSGLRVRPSPKEVEALVALLGDIPDDERQVHFEMPVNPSDAEISVMLDLLADDSSNSVPTESLAVAIILEPEETLDIQRLDSTRPKHPRRANQPTSAAEGKKKRRLRRVSCSNQDVGPSVPAAEGVHVELSFGADPNGCDSADADPNGCNPADLDDAKPNGCGVRIVDEDEEEEEEIPLIRKNNRRYVVSGESSEIPSLALSALVGLQELSLANFDQALEDVIPKICCPSRQMVV
jgi:hypothetical protein